MAASVFLHVVGDFAGLGQRERRIDGQRHLGVEAMTKPPRPHQLDARDPACMLRGVAEFTDDLRLDAVEHPGQHCLGRLPDDPKDHNGNDEADDGIGEREIPSIRRKRRGQPPNW